MKYILLLVEWPEIVVYFKDKRKKKPKLFMKIGKIICPFKHNHVRKQFYKKLQAVGEFDIIYNSFCISALEFILFVWNCSTAQYIKVQYIALQ